MSKFSSVAATLGLVAALAAAPAQAAPVTFLVSLSGLDESPVNASPAVGLAKVIFDLVAHTMHVEATFSDLTGTTTAAHIHCCTAVARAGTVSVATKTPTFTLFPLGVTSSSFAEDYDMSLASSYNAPFLAANGGSAFASEIALYNGARAGKAYFNIHTTAFPGGEIRGFLNEVPEPASLALVLLALGGAGLSTRRRAGQHAAQAFSV